MSKPGEMDSTEELIEALKNNLSPDAICHIYAHLQAFYECRNDVVNGETLWFRGVLEQMLGDAQPDLCEAIGI